MSVSKFTRAATPSLFTTDSQESHIESVTPGPLPMITNRSAIEEKTNTSTGYIYQYGIKNIALSYASYEDTGVFVTKPIEVKGNIVEVSLSAIEDHPLFNELGGMATDRVTSIEYYVSMDENPSTNDWYPILPKETKTVKCEKLFLQGSSATLRFIADISSLETKVYKNYILMGEEEWYFIERGAAIQFAVTPDSKAIYTIDYVPNAELCSPWDIQVSNHSAIKTRSTEVFHNGTDHNNTITLSHYPYIDYNAIQQIENYDPNLSDYRPIEVFLTNGTIAAGNGQTQKEFYPTAYKDTEEFTTKNRTDYKNSSDPSLKKYSIVPGAEYKVFEYKQEKNKLVFTESFNRANFYFNEATNHGNATITVQYDHLATHFRLKIILRKNTGEELVVTPMVISYQLKFKVMK